MKKMNSNKLLIMWLILITISCSILSLRFSIFSEFLDGDEDEYLVNPYSVNNLFIAWKIVYERKRSHLETFEELGNVFFHPICAISDYDSDFYHLFSAIEAYDSGKLIQDNLENNKDLANIYNIDYLGNDINVYPENYFIDKKPEDIFSKEWILAIMEDYPLCGPFNSSGFMLGDGRIWYQLLKVNGDTRLSIETLNFNF